jgi:hypothetical protein
MRHCPQRLLLVLQNTFVEAVDAEGTAARAIRGDGDVPMCSKRKKLPPKKLRLYMSIWYCVFGVEWDRFTITLQKLGLPVAV